MTRTFAAVLTTAIVCVTATALATVSAVPEPVSPGHRGRFVHIAGQTPTFNWSSVSAARGFEIVIYEISEASPASATEMKPVMQVRISGSALGWTPSSARGLAPGGKYAWAVRAAFAEGLGDWSEPLLFQVEQPEQAARIEAARGLSTITEKTRSESGSGLAPETGTAANGSLSQPVTRGGSGPRA